MRFPAHGICRMFSRALLRSLFPAHVTGLHVFASNSDWSNSDRWDLNNVDNTFYRIYSSDL